MVLGFQYVQLDDGYDRDETGQHYRIENGIVGFRHGPQALPRAVRS